MYMINFLSYNTNTLEWSFSYWTIC